jgi:hypothetical protein
MTLADLGDVALLALALAGWLGREGLARRRRPSRANARPCPAKSIQPKEAQ